MRSDLATFLGDYRRHGDAAAIVVHRGNRRLVSSWNQIADLADRFASELIRREIPLGERVVIWGQNGPEWMGAFFGCIQRGVIAVPLDPAGALDFANRVIDNTKPRLVIGDANLLRELAPDLPTLGFEDFPAALPQAPQTSLRDPGLTLDTPFQILFTSGTTAEPKGIVHTHRNVLASLDPIETEMKKYLKYERPFHPLHFLHTLPLSHVFGQFMGLWIPPLLGAEVHFESRLQAQRLIETIRRERIAVISCVPRVLDLLRSHLLAVDPKLADRIQQAAGKNLWRRWWRFRKIHFLFGYRFWAFVCGGASLSPELEGFWATMAFLLVQGYGMTETSAIITLNHPFKTHQGTIGQILPGREVRITDEGEILVRGDVVSRATWKHGALQQNESEWLATAMPKASSTSWAARARSSSRPRASMFIPKMWRPRSMPSPAFRHPPSFRCSQPRVPNPSPCCCFADPRSKRIRPSSTPIASSPSISRSISGASGPSLTCPAPPPARSAARK
jgi:long-chain acyl-CoA synthetase